MLPTRADVNRLLTALFLGLPVFTQGIEAYRQMSDYYVDLDIQGWTRLLSNLNLLCFLPIKAQTKYSGIYDRTSLSGTWVTELLDGLSWPLHSASEPH
jgi:hypothetical protein